MLGPMEPAWVVLIRQLEDQLVDEITRTALLDGVIVSTRPEALLISGRPLGAVRRTDCAWRATAAVARLWAAAVVPTEVHLSVHFEPVIYETRGEAVEAVGKGAPRSWWWEEVKVIFGRAADSPL